MAARKLAGLAGAAVLTFGVAQAGPLAGDVWQAPTAPLGSAPITDLTVKGTEYWGTSDTGIVKSTNLTTWTRVTTTGLTDTPVSLRWTGTQFVGGGLGLWTSPDGVEWTFRASSYPFAPLSMEVRGNVVVGVGLGGAVVRSADGGVTWTHKSLGLDRALLAVTATATHFVAVGAGGLIYNSPDGITWEQRASNTSVTLYDVAVTAGRVVAVGGDATVLTSTDHGTTWTGYAISGGAGIRLTAVGGDASTTIIGGPPRLILRTTSPANAASMQAISFPDSSAQITSIVRSAGGWVMGGHGGTILTSTDSNTWTLRQPTVSAQFMTAVRTSSRFIAAGFPSDKLSLSADGVTWTSQTTPIPIADGHAISSLTWAGSPAKLVAGTSGGRIYSTTSATGSGLVQRTSPTTQRLNPGVWTGSLFIVPGINGALVTSPNGDTWTSRNSGTTFDLTGAASSGTRHVACGGYQNSGVLTTSTNGTTWTPREFGGYLLAVAWQAGLFVAVGGSGVIYTSPDGLDWTERPVSVDGVPYQETLTSVAWAGTNWVAMDAKGGALLSTDGMTWHLRPYASTRVTNAMCYDNATLLAAGDSGLLLTSTAVPARAPFFRVPPLSTTWDAGARNLLGFIVEGTPPLSYQWRKNGEPIPGAQRALLTFDSPGVLDDADYDVVITGPGGTVTSAAAHVRVRAPAKLLTFTAAEQYVPAGGTATFTATAAGAGPLTWQWYKTGSGALAGRTSSTLTVNPVTPADAGEYYVDVRNEYGGEASAPARLTLTVSLTDALDTAPGLVQLTTGGLGGATGWAGVTNHSRDGTDSASSGLTPNGGESWMELSVTGMSAIHFWWDVSSQSCCDQMYYFVNGEYREHIEGTDGTWRQQSIPLKQQDTTLIRWRYIKYPGNQGPAGADRGWVDQITFTPGSLRDYPVWAAELNLPANRRAATDRNGPLQIENSLAYALGINPLTATPADLPAFDHSSTSLSLYYSRTRRSGGTLYRVEWTDDPEKGVWSFDGVSGTGVMSSTPERDFVLARVGLPVYATRRFIRLRISLSGE